MEPEQKAKYIPTRIKEKIYVLRKGVQGFPKVAIISP